MTIDTGFFGSKYFLISAVVAALLLGGAAGAYYIAERSDGTVFSFSGGCATPALGGSNIPVPSPTVTDSDGGRRRLVEYTLEASQYAGGALKACVDVGAIQVEPAAGSHVQIVFEIVGDTSGAVEATKVDAAFAERAGALSIGAWQSQRGETNGFFHDEGAAVHVTVRLPATGAYDLDLSSDVGNVRVGDLLVGDLEASTDVGHIAVSQADLTGNVTLTTEVGDIDLVAASVQTSRIELSVDVGDVNAQLPRRAEIGYDVEASADVGSVSVDIGPTEAMTSEEDGPSEHKTARSQGYADKVTKVRVTIVTDVGDGTLTTS